MLGDGAVAVNPVDERYARCWHLLRDPVGPKNTPRLSSEIHNTRRHTQSMADSGNRGAVKR